MLTPREVQKNITRSNDFEYELHYGTFYVIFRDTVCCKGD
jgi:hypothetical protein